MAATKVTKESDDPKVKDLGDSTGNSTKDPEAHDDEDSMKAAIGKAEKETTKVVKIKEDSADDGEAFVSPEERKAQAWSIPIGKDLLADAEDGDDDNKGTTRKVNFDFVKRLEVNRAQREQKKKVREEKNPKLTKAEMSPAVNRMIDEEVEKRLKEKTPQKDKGSVSKKLFFDDEDKET